MSTDARGSGGDIFRRRRAMVGPGRAKASGRGSAADGFRARRALVLDWLGDAAMVLPAAAEACRRGADPSPYRPDSEFFYLTGFSEPGGVLVLRGFAESKRSVLFVRPRDATAELWGGKRLGPEAARERLGVTACHPLNELGRELGALLRGASRVFFRLGSDPWVDRLVRAALAYARARGARAGFGPRGVVDPGEILDEMRLRKDAGEVKSLREAAALTIAGHRALAGELRGGAGEWELQAAIEAVFRRRGGATPAYPSIVASGANACVLHYAENRRRARAGELVLVDAAAELGHYCADVTRTYPVDGRFTPDQRAVYEIVDAARAAAIGVAAPGVPVSRVHKAACAVLAEGLASLGILAASGDGPEDSEVLRRFFPHQTSHWLGLDTHDVGDYAVGGRSRPLEEGMVFTVEPGLYFREDAEGPAARFAGTGIRIEDDVLVTASGVENLTAELPAEAGAVEALAGAR